MIRSQLVRTCLLLVLTLPATAALAQGPPPPLQPLPPPPVPNGNPITAAKTFLGKALFWDEQMSSSRTMACGSCHQPASGGGDGRSRAGRPGVVNPGPDNVFGTPDDILGSPGVVLRNADGSLSSSTVFGAHEQVTGRRSPSVVNSAYAQSLFWDGRAGSAFLDPITDDVLLPNGAALESQAAGPPVSSAEMGHLGRDWANVASRIAASKPLALAARVPSDLSGWIAGRGYADLFAEAFGTPEVTASRIAMAIATYERTQYSTQTPFDSLIAGIQALTQQENQGLQLFGGPAGCAACHAGSLTSDNAYHYIGVRPATEDVGRFAVTNNAADIGAFKTPTLRNVALHGAFFHDGKFTTLAEVVDFYDRGGDFNAPSKDPRIHPLGLNPQQKAALVAFLSRPLTDPRVAAETAPFDRPGLYRESLSVPFVGEDGVAGSGAQTPQLVVIDPPLAGNPEFTVGVYGGLGGASAVLVIDEDPPAAGAIPASGSFARIEATLQGAGDGAGYGSATLAIADDPSLVGRAFYGRWYVTDPQAPGGVAATAVFRMTVFGAGGVGIQALEVPTAGTSTGGTLRLYAGQPNPFRSSGTTIRYALPAASAVRLVVYDVTGRVVKQLQDSPRESAGAHAVAWDGRDESGHTVPGGVYFYRLQSGGAIQTSRVVRVE